MALWIAELRCSLAHMQETSPFAQPDPRMPELIADLAHAGMPVGASADVDIVHINREARQRRILAYGYDMHLISNDTVVLRVNSGLC